jgi:hypothetical protein
MRFIKLTRGYWAIVDAEDYEHVMQWKWHAHGGSSRKWKYAARKIRRRGGPEKTRFLHHEVLGYEPCGGLVVDHIDGNTLNCRKGNLRLCTKQQNNWHRRGRCDARHTKYKGIQYNKETKIHRAGWSARIFYGGKRYYLGYFPDEYTAVKVYNVWAYRFFGKYAYLNRWEGETTEEDLKRMAEDRLSKAGYG